jgi:ABC-type uncharacterized transport system substrate-binding protein
MSAIGLSGGLRSGRTCPLCPSISDINLFRYCQSIVDFNAKVSNRAFASDIARAITAFADKPDGGLIALPHPLTVNNGPMIIALAALHRMPTVNAFRNFAAVGGLLSYGAEPADLWRRSASYVDRIFHGANRRTCRYRHRLNFNW